MVPDKFNMVDMGGIDLIRVQGLEVEGLYDRLVESILPCRYQCLYNWYFDGVLIPPTYVELSVGENVVYINSGVSVDSDDIVHISSIEYAVEPLSVTQNGVYEAQGMVAGYNPVTVNLQFSELSASENGTYTPEEPVKGFSSVVVNVVGASRYLLILNTFEEPVSISGVCGTKEATCLTDGATSYLMLPITGNWQITASFESGTSVKSFLVEDQITKGVILPPYTISDLKSAMALTTYARLSNNSSDRSDFNGRWFQRSTNEPLIVCNYKSLNSSYYSYCWLTFGNTAPSGTWNSYGNLQSGGSFSVGDITVYMWVMAGMWSSGNPTYTLDSASVTLDAQTVGQSGIIKHQTEMELFITILYNILQEG